MFQQTQAQCTLPVAWLKFCFGLTLTAVALYSAPCLQAQEPPRLGDRFVVNGYTPDYERGGAVSVNDDGSFVVVWSSGLLPNTSSYRTVQVRRFDSAGVALGDDFQVNTSHEGTDFAPQVDSASNGDFVVVWTRIANVNGGVDRSIQARQFLSDGTPVGDPFRVNVPTLNDNREPRVEVASNGDFIVVWTTETSIGNDGDEESIQGRRFGSAGAPLDDPFQVNTGTTGRQRAPGLAANPDGVFLVAWESYVNGSGGARSNVWVQLFNAEGNRVGQEFPVSGDGPGFRRDANISADPDGDFRVVWVDGSDAANSLCHSLDSRRVFSNGSFAGAAQELVELSDTCKWTPSIAHESNGGFVVVWSHEPVYSSASYPFGRRFNADGDPLTDPFQIGPVHGYSVGGDIGMDEVDNFVVVWDGSTSVPMGEEAFGIYAQRFCGLDCLLFDGFESGDTTAWSTTMGQ